MYNKNIPLIYYHSVAPRKNPFWFKSFLTLEMKYFEEHLKYFSSNGYTFITLQEYIQMGHDDGKKKYVNLSFDDGYLDNYTYVFPLLKKYNAKATFFINPVYVDKQNTIRKNLNDYHEGKIGFEELNEWGFLSWEEMRLMEKSSVVDIQSHTMTHTKYFISDKLTGFHMPGGDCLYPVGNLFPERLPYYIEDSGFEKLLPYGFPFFQSASSVIARKVEINESFNQEVVSAIEQSDWGTVTYDDLLKKTKTIYDEYKKTDSIIVKKESDEEYNARVHGELLLSKKIIERELDKNVEICSWPHGDNNDYVQNIAVSLGYKATTAGDPLDKSYKFNAGYRLPPRISLSKNGYSYLQRLRAFVRFNSLEQKFPYHSANAFYRKLKNKSY